MDRGNLMRGSCQTRMTTVANNKSTGCKYTPWFTTKVPIDKWCDGRATVPIDKCGGGGGVALVGAHLCPSAATALITTGHCSPKCNSMTGGDKSFCFLYPTTVNVVTPT
eukprot:GHVS01001582.1.p3 GENE.GHVS01001582.1~~GHVS01001582.1.p3  ORF type:complete len:109 (-),score=23.67 GHVS01001582.1:21-347(-)